MSYRSTRQVVEDLLRHGRAIVYDGEVDADLEIAEIQRRVYQSGGPAVLLTRVKNCQFPVATNLFGTLERARFLFRSTFESVQSAIRWKLNPREILGQPSRLMHAPMILWRMRPKAMRSGGVLRNTCRLSQLPMIRCWPNDGGAFITLPQVLSQPPHDRRFSACNLGMYRIQMSGNEYTADEECGLHYQIHRGIGVHHAQTLAAGQPFQVTVTVGGSPAMTLAAVMPLPEGLSELGLAGALAGHRIPMITQQSGPPIYADADFCIVGQVANHLKPEGPFGDHLGYYAKVHEFPFLKVHKVYYRDGAVWPMTVVGRPPQEDTTFGQLIHELTEPAIPAVIAGVHQVHAVDASGVHPLLLAIGSERYTPYAKPGRPQELLTQASAILGQGQLSLAKYLMIVDHQDNPQLACQDIPGFLAHLLARADWCRDLHFQTRTTIDTLDYSGEGFNQGSKLVVAAAGPARYELARELSSDLRLPESWQQVRLMLPGILVVKTQPYVGQASQLDLHRTCDAFGTRGQAASIRWIVIVDDPEFATQSLNNFLWVTFTRSNPASDVYGFGAFSVDKHFGCRGSLVIDARTKPQHAQPLVEDPHITAKVDAIASRGGPLARFL